MTTTRKLLRKQRQSLTKSQQYKASINILHNLLKHNILRYKHIALYIPFDGEVSTGYIINFLQRHNVEIYLPVLNNKKLQFSCLTKQFKKNKFGIPEPLSSPVSAKKINVVLTPLVGFDENNNRIGMGGGFYDRTFAFKHKQQKFCTPKLFGLAYRFQQTVITPNPWDVALDKVIVG
jgi:5-formyltetrahydrofolate cyclo-ligase